MKVHSFHINVPYKYFSGSHFRITYTDSTKYDSVTLLEDVGLEMSSIW